jgi:hypothetical protein
LHPIRQVHVHPTVYEFANPIKGTYPPWTDPGYWYEGFEPTFAWRSQLDGLRISLYRYRTVLTQSKFGVLLVGLFGAAAAWLIWKRALVRWEIRPYAFLVLPACAALAMIALLVVESQYVAGFLAMLILGGLAAVRLPRGLWRTARRIAVGLVLASAVGLVVLSFRTSQPFDQYMREQGLATVRALQEAGIKPGANIAVVGGPALTEYGARFARVRIVAEIPRQEKDELWKLEEPGRAELLDTFARCGAAAVIARDVPESAHPDGWQRIGTSTSYLYILAPR